MGKLPPALSFETPSTNWLMALSIRTSIITSDFDAPGRNPMS